MVVAVVAVVVVAAPAAADYSQGLLHLCEVYTIPMPTNHINIT